MRTILTLSRIWWLAGATLLTGCWLQGDTAFARTVMADVLMLMPLIAIAAGLAGWMGTSYRSEHIAIWLRQRPITAIVVASLAGAVTPVCGIAMVPLVAALLRHGVPLAAAMAFWLSSPITDPGMFTLTIGFLGWPFAMGMVVAAFLMGILAGAVTSGLPLSFASPTDVGANDACRHGSYERTRFWQESVSTFWLILRWMLLALSLEALMQHYLPASVITSMLGHDSPWSVPLAVLIGAPLYLEGYAALPLVRGMIDLGMSYGAAMGLLIAGASISLYAAVAVWSLVSRRIFVVYTGFAVIGSILAGWATDWSIALYQAGGL